MSSVKLSINKPCSENWNNFEKKGNTGFCASCQKNVIDFTKYTDQEIIEFFKNDSGKTCGRFKEDQLKVYNVKENGSAFSKIAAVVTAGVLILTQAPNAYAQAKEISGRVISEDQEPVPATNIHIKGTGQETWADVDGNFRLPYNGSSEEITLVYSFIGYKQAERTINLSELSNIGEVILEAENTVLQGEVIIVRRKWHGIGGIIYGVKSLFTSRY